MDTDKTSPGYLLDTSILSSLVDSDHSRHQEVSNFVSNIKLNDLNVSAIALGELIFGVKSSEEFHPLKYPKLVATIDAAKKYPYVDVTHATSDFFAELKTILAVVYRPALANQKRPRWLEDWSDEVRAKTLQIDENDLWLCAQAKERNLTLLTADKRIKRIGEADKETKIKFLGEDDEQDRAAGAKKVTAPA